jgi:hypothetical protein
MATLEPLLPGDIRATGSADSGTKEQSLLTITVTADILGGTRNLVFDGQEFFLVHGDRRYSLFDEYLLRRRADQLGIKVKDLEQIMKTIETTIKQKIALLTREEASTSALSSLSSLA